MKLAVFLRKHRWTILIVLLLLIVNVVALRWSSRFLYNPDEILLRYGARMPSLSGALLNGSGKIQIKQGSPTLIIYISEAQSLSRTIAVAKYAELISRRYGNEGLQVAAIVRGNVPEIRTLMEHSLLNYSILSDPEGNLGNKLGVSEGESASFWFNTKGECLFSTRRPLNAEDLRQLAEVEFARTNPFRQEASDQLEKGQPLRDLTLLDARTLAETSLRKIHSQASDLLVFFTADCSVCSLPNYLKKFVAFDQQRRAGSKVSKQAALIFDFNFSQLDVVKQLEQAGVNCPAYIAGEELTEVNNLARHNMTDLGQAVAVEIDERNNVREISPLKEIASEPQSPPAAQVQNTSSTLPSQEFVYEKAFRQSPYSSYDLAAYNGHYYVADLKGNRILELDGAGKVVGEIGGIGSGPGRLLHPGFIDVSSDGTLYVQDGGNERIQRFSADGKYAGEFRASHYEGFAVSPANEVYLGQPENNALVTVYSSTGKKLRSFGQLKKFSEIYGDKFKHKDDLYKIAINRVRLFIDQQGATYVSFMLAPLIQKYDLQGHLLFEVRLEGPEIDRLTRVLLTDTLDKYLSISMDGFEERIIALDPVVEPASGNILVLLVDGSIYGADKDGRRLFVSRPQKDHDFTPYMAGLGTNGEMMVISFFEWGCYRVQSRAAKHEAD